MIERVKIMDNFFRLAIKKFSRLGNLDVIFMDEYFENELTTNFEKYFLQAEPY